jgi:alcohol dehydrogenase
VVDQGKVGPGEVVAVHGCGGVGLSAINIARACGATVIAVDIDEKKLELAQSLGADFAINAKKVPNVPAEIIKFSDRGAHVSVDALGSQETCFNSISCLRKRGKHIQVGLMTGDHQNARVPMDKVLANELEIIGSHGMQSFRYEAVFALIESGKVSPSKMIGREITLWQAPQALRNMDKFESLGITIIKFQEEDTDEELRKPKKTKRRKKSVMEKLLEMSKK